MAAIFLGEESHLDQQVTEPDMFLLTDHTFTFPSPQYLEGDGTVPVPLNGVGRVAGEMKIISCSLSSVTLRSLKSCPSTGIFPRKGTCVTVFVASSVVSPPITAVSPS